MNSLENIVCERRSYSENANTHIHAYAQLMVPICGSISVAADSNLFADNRPDVIYIPPALTHSFYSQTLNQFFVFDIPSAYLLKGSDRTPRCYSLDETWKAIRILLSEEVGEKPASNQRLSDLLRYILRLIERETPPGSIEFIHKNYHQPITIQQLADMEHYHPSYYCEWFYKQMGCSPMSYIRQLRLDDAKRMLEHTDYTIMQIAQQVGYQHQATLTRLFHEHVGMSPAGYRAKSRMPVKKEPYLD